LAFTPIPDVNIMAKGRESGIYIYQILYREYMKARSGI
jgi:hypothetical protein